VLGLARPAAVADEKDTAKSPAKGAPSADEKAPPKEPDPFVVPDGTPEELLKYIGRLYAGRPSGSSAPVVAEFRKKTSEALLEASEKLLAAKLNEDQKKAAVGHKLMALRALEMMGDAKATKKLDAFPGELPALKIDDPELVRKVALVQLQSRLRRASRANAKDLANVLGDVTKFVAAGPIDGLVAQTAINAAMLAEHTDHTDLAIQAYQDLGKLLSASKEERIASLGLTLQGAARRLGLVGKPFFLEGTTVEGKPFQWSQYKGKVVLVDFWATWCPPCRAELVNIEKNYDDYHDRGFDVVGVSVDHNRAELDKFLEGHKHPWTVLHDNHDASKAAKSMSAYYGVFAIPTVILVGADGTVISTTARGEELGTQLRKLFGPPKPKKTTKAEEPPGGPHEKAEKAEKTEKADKASKEGIAPPPGDAKP
jgi:thiol-disulfide isomerase/thioredoxin